MQDIFAPRSHAEIIRSPTAASVHSTLQNKGFASLTIGSVNAWAMRDSIPGEYWKALAEGGFATLDELAAYAESKKVAPVGAAAEPDADRGNPISSVPPPQGKEPA